MNKKLIFVGLGWIMGFVSAYFLIRKDFDAQLQEEIEKTREYYRTLEKKRPKNNEKSEEKSLKEPKTPREKSGEWQEEKKKEYAKYENMANIYREPIPEPLDVKEMQELHPYVIDEDTYFENELNYEQVNLTYYQEDEVLCYEYEEILDNIDYLIGFDALESFEGDVVYVCNEKIGSMYEITRLHTSYRKAVLGVGTDD